MISVSRRGRSGPIVFAAMLLGLSLSTPLLAAGPEPVLLWPDGAPGAVGTEDQDKPAVRIYSPPEGQGNGTAVVICPGGGYAILATDHEGTQVARWFQSKGVTSLVLRYRLGKRYKHPAPLEDVQRALRYARANATTLKISPDRVGVMGFSAGGHLASTVATHFDRGRKDSQDPIDRESCRPDFAILGYPVVSLTADFSHKGSGGNLLGENPNPELLKNLSNETQVTAETPPTFMFHTAEDTGVPPENSVAFFLALRKAKVPAELHIFQQGPHGVGLAPGEPALFTWKDRLHDWLRQNGLLASGKRANISGKVIVNGTPLKWGQITFTPIDSKDKPVGFAMISNGNFRIPAERGLFQGNYQVLIYNQGNIIAEPTIEDVKELTNGRLQRSVEERDTVFDIVVTAE